MLGDLTRYPWPFAYGLPGGDKILRAPLGMYLLPALIGKQTGAYGAELALLGQNVLLLGLVLALGSTLFAGVRQKWTALAVFFGFSGMDILGQLLAGRSPWLHLEQWAGMQYTANLTQAFWVPQHALAGWIVAVLYLLWVRGQVPRVALFAAMPLLALLSPFALMGGMPFAIHAFVAGVARRDLAWGDIVWPGLVSLITLPGLAYLTAGSGAVATGSTAFRAGNYIIFLALEVGAYLYALWLARGHWRFGLVPTGLVMTLLVLIPFGRIGDANDFSMRASIPALAMLTMMIVCLLEEPAPHLQKPKRLILIALTIGLATPLGEIARAVVWPSSPLVRCSYVGVAPGGAPTYVTPIAGLPKPLRPANVTVIHPRDPAKCWDRPWINGATGHLESYHEGL